MPVQLISAPSPSTPVLRGGHTAPPGLAPAGDGLSARRSPWRPAVPGGRRASPPAAPARDGYPFIDRVRGVAALVIMLHHLLGYVPAAGQGLPLPAVVNDAIWWHGGLAAQVFLVVGGFVGGLSLARTPPSVGGLGRFLLARYLRLAVPAVAALGFAMAIERIVPAAWAAFPLFDDFSWASVLAHGLLLQDVLGYPSLMTGFWYLPVDWQCSGLLAVVFIAHAAILRRQAATDRWAWTATLLALAAPAAVLSLSHWNGAAAHEPFATHYFALVFLGSLAGLAAVGRIPPGVFWAAAAACTAAAIIRGRPQPAVAAVAAVAFHLVARRGASPLPRPTLLDRLGRISYSLFLIHYPTIWGVTSLGRGLAGDDAAALAPWIAATVPASVLAAVVLHRLVEVPAVALAGRLRERPPVRSTPPAERTASGASAAAAG
jgi:peptidoglycan/LPS O-acetylase OafA/YrhL